MSLLKWKKDEDEFSTTAGTKGGSRPGTGATLAAVESLAMPLVQEVVFLADFRCARCQERVAEILSKMNGETQSVMISVLEKNVTLTCTYPTADNHKLPERQIASMHRRSWSKISLMVRLFRSSCCT